MQAYDCVIYEDQRFYVCSEALEQDSHVFIKPLEFSLPDDQSIRVEKSRVTIVPNYTDFELFDEFYWGAGGNSHRVYWIEGYTIYAQHYRYNKFGSLEDCNKFDYNDQKTKQTITPIFYVGDRVKLKDRIAVAEEFRVVGTNERLITGKSGMFCRISGQEVNDVPVLAKNLIKTRNVRFRSATYRGTAIAKDLSVTTLYQLLTNWRDKESDDAFKRIVDFVYGASE